MDYNLISKYLLGEATEHEIGLVFEWIDLDPKNKEAFIRIMKLWALNAKGNKDVEREWKKLRRLILRKNRTYRIKNMAKYAAVLVGVLSTALYIKNYTGHSTTNVIDENEITLTTENGKTIVLKEKDVLSIQTYSGELVVKQVGNSIVYGDYSKKTTTEKLIYNELFVPYGKKFQLVLSDGSKVHLNAGSSLRYPIQFMTNYRREVYLNGEAFFDISKDSLHPFVVNTNAFDVKVLGTKFNVSSFSEEDVAQTVLVEGSVQMQNKTSAVQAENLITLLPGQKGEILAQERNIKVSEVDTSVYTSWLDGVLVFKNMAFKEIRKKLERNYNVRIYNNNLLLEEKTFNATFDVETIEQVLRTINENFPIEYSIQDKVIVIN